MRRHFLALEAFDNTSTGSPTDAETAKPDAAAALDGDPAASASAPSAGAPVPAEPTGAGTNPEPSEPDEAKPVDPADAPALPAEAGVDPAPIAQDAPTPAEAPATPAPAVPSEPTNASTDSGSAEGGESTQGEAPSASTADEPTATEPADAAGAASSAETPVDGADDQPTPAGGAPEADSEAMESMREMLELSHAMEEAAFAMAEGGETAAEINHDLAESERVIQVSDALEDLAFVASTIKTATPAEAALMETAGNLAVAGTDVEPDVIIPAMESYIGTTIATEGIKETAKRIWEAIVLFVEKIWGKIRGFWRIHGSIPTWRKKIEALRKKASTVGDEAVVPEAKVSVDLHGLVMGSGIDSDSFTQHIERDFADFAKTIHGVFANYANGVVERGHAIVKAIGEFDPNRPEKAVNDLKGKLVGMHPDGMTPGESKKLLGNAKLELNVYEPHPDEPVDQALERMRASGLKLVQGDVHVAAKMARAQIALRPGNKSQWVQLLSQCDDLVGSLEHFYSGPYHELDKMADQAKAASKSATAAIGKAGEAAMGEGKALHHYRSLLNFNKAFADWSYQPFVPLYNYALRTLRSILAVIDAALTCFEVTAPKGGKAKPAAA
ncbi:hypothetical protein AWB81_04237 [Caballeronia arationis]|uniref:hypothetical protein n=1 Tax=Caballeronia arationis TaxID=1777142 RepID=UPI00074BBE7E|nr:hypothetical protein [Caballeronia arationis]SAK83766.1 hypothetical protein AWB81_04237 [Caballeronia arationis]